MLPLRAFFVRFELTQHRPGEAPLSFENTAKVVEIYKVIGRLIDDIELDRPDQADLFRSILTSIRTTAFKPRRDPTFRLPPPPRLWGQPHGPLYIRENPFITYLGLGADSLSPESRIAAAKGLIRNLSAMTSIDERGGKKAPNVQTMLKIETLRNTIATLIKDIELDDPMMAEGLEEALTWVTKTAFTRNMFISTRRIPNLGPPPPLME